ncbi:MAG TPA: hypothetical protein VFP65_00920 [Anaeromyxobacteraceae bacterium]|nr:hypothetical protein [Anaeromyxobacteraceae bacterium]
MNVRNGYGAVHHLVDVTGRLLCGHTEPSFDWCRGVTDAAVTPSACVRLLADDARRAGPSTHESED